MRQEIAKRERLPSPRKGLRRIYVASLLIMAPLLLAVPGLAWLSSTTDTADERAARAAPPEASVVLAEVSSRVLEDAVVLRGVVRPRREVSVDVPAGGDGPSVVTRLPLSHRDSVAEGDVILEVSGRPVLLIQGDYPVYRDLRPGLEGPDVLQLQHTLERLGLFTETPSGQFGESTKRAVADMYAAAGYDTPMVESWMGLTLDAAVRNIAEAAAALEVARSEVATETAPPPPAVTREAKEALAVATRNFEFEREQATVTETLLTAALELRRADLQEALEVEPAPPESALSDAKLLVSQAEAELGSSVAAHQLAIQNASGVVDLANSALADLVKPKEASAASAANVALAEETLARANVALSNVAALTGAMVPFGETVALATLPMHVSEIKARVGAPPTSPIAIVTSEENGTVRNFVYRV